MKVSTCFLCTKKVSVSFVITLPLHPRDLKYVTSLSPLTRCDICLLTRHMLLAKLVQECLQRVLLFCRSLSPLLGLEGVDMGAWVQTLHTSKSKRFCQSCCGILRWSWLILSQRQTTLQWLLPPNRAEYISSGVNLFPSDMLSANESHFCKASKKTLTVMHSVVLYCQSRETNACIQLYTPCLPVKQLKFASVPLTKCHSPNASLCGKVEWELAFGNFNLRHRHAMCEYQSKKQCWR